jgi:AcrR family transcriptional regulator
MQAPTIQLVSSAAVDDSEDPRIARTRALVMQTAMELLAQEGPEAVTHARVAATARMSRSTLYKYWPAPEDLLFAALAQIVNRFDLDGAGRLRDELIAELGRSRRELNQPMVRVAFTTVLSHAPIDDAAAELRDRFLSNVTEALRHSIDSAVGRGELRPGLDAKLLEAKVMGALAWRSFVEGDDVDDAFIVQIVDDALAGWETS